MAKNERRPPYTDEDGWTVLTNRAGPKGWLQCGNIATAYNWHCNVPRALAALCNPLVEYVEKKLAASGHKKLRKLRVRVEFVYDWWEPPRCSTTHQVCEGNKNCGRAAYQSCPKGYRHPKR